MVYPENVDDTDIWLHEDYEAADDALGEFWMSDDYGKLSEVQNRVVY